MVLRCLLIMLIPFSVFGQKIEAEDMEILNGNATIYHDTSIAMFGNSTISFECDDSGQCKITIVAYEHNAGEGHALLEISAPNTEFDTLAIDSTDWKEFRTQMNVTAGTWFLSFINDYYADDEDRNLIIDYIELEFIKPPTRLRYDAKFCLSWDHSPSEDVEYYSIYYGFVSRKYVKKINVGYVTKYCIDSLICDTTYYFTATATDSAGNESDYSNEIFDLHHCVRGDWDNSGVVDYPDLRELRRRFGSSDDYFDFDGSGLVDYRDLKYFRESLFGTSG